MSGAQARLAAMLATCLQTAVIALACDLPHSHARCSGWQAQRVAPALLLGCCHVSSNPEPQKLACGIARLPFNYDCPEIKHTQEQSAKHIFIESA